MARFRRDGANTGKLNAPVDIPAPPVTEAPPSPVGSSARKTSPNAKASKPASSNRAARLRSPPPSARLQIKTSGKGKQESWTVTTTTKPLTKGSKQPSFRVRVSDVGFRVCLVFYDDEGLRRERYLCYLSATEWKNVKRGSLANFTKVIADKLTERAAKEDADGEKLDELLSRVKAFA
ncbi:MAG TPA: hypothetical protein PKD31_02435 [Blastocatellia bacterium]|nr:hypothetical protein [Blastocatellia bacterium]